MIPLPDYIILRRLPPGGTTDIFLARAADARTVAIRVLRPEFAGTRKWRQMFMQGADLLRQLDHPNIVRCLDAGEEDGLPYVVVEYVSSTTLRSLILHRNDLLRNNLLLLLRQMASALYYVHSMGYLHLDFKPDNILVSEDAHVTLIDFDLALPIQRHPVKLKDLDGTPFYMPRETLLRRTVDERADIYALGVTAYEMIAHRKPFGGHTPEEARSAQADLASSPAPLAGHDGAITAALESLIFKCLAKKPDARYPSMSLVLKALDDLV